MLVIEIAVFYSLLLSCTGKVDSFRCDRRPYGSTAQASPADGRFQLTVQGVNNNAYLPEQVYTVQISADENSQFTGFMISAEGDVKTDPHNPRRAIAMLPGEVRPQNNGVAKFSDRCLYSVEQTMRSVKSSVEVYWQAPPTGHGCVTLRAMVAENDELWYEDGSPLTQKLCEDLRQPDDVSPVINEQCQICDEAKYEISFTGIWSRNTHPQLYPENDWVPRYSDLVGATHSIDFVLWNPGSMASEGLQELSEHTNSSKLEKQIREKIGDGVRTLIKGKGHGYRKMSNPTFSFFRADKQNHLVSVAVAIHPSPDWFLGVTRFELCQEDNTWLPERELNLYPWDAGTDSGISYESPNSATYPQDTINRVEMSTYNTNSPFYGMDMADMHPFGKLRIKFVRNYHRQCEEETTETTNPDEVATASEGTPEESSNPEEPEPPSRYQSSAIDSSGRGRDKPTVVENEHLEDCPISPWQEWSECDGTCENGKIVGYKWHERYHLVDGVAVEKYNPNGQINVGKEVSKYCKEHLFTFERVECEEKCDEHSKDYDEDEI